MLLKICGLTTEADAVHAAAAGATALGVVFAPASPRCVTRRSGPRHRAALPPDVPVVGVFVDALAGRDRGDGGAYRHPRRAVARGRARELRGGAEDAAAAGRGRGRGGGELAEGDCCCSTRCRAAQRGGTGTRVDWQQAAAIARRRKVVLAGGLTPDNVAEADGDRAPVRRGRVVGRGGRARPEEPGQGVALPRRGARGIRAVFVGAGLQTRPKGLT